MCFSAGPEIVCFSECVCVCVYVCEREVERERESVFNVSESEGHLETLNVMLGVVGQHMKVHHHPRAVRSC